MKSPFPVEAWQGRLLRMAETLMVNEIYLSLQGESTRAGWPCVFVRLTACNLRCSYCDTAYAFKEGRKMTLAKVCQEVQRLAKPYGSAPRGARTRSPQNGGKSNGADPNGERLPLVEITGGEPLLQRHTTTLMEHLCEEGFTVLLETSGAHDISLVDPRVHRIMDLKCPSSGESERNLWSNLEFLTRRDEIKFVIGTVEDYEWTKDVLAKHRLAEVCPVLISWVQPLASSQKDPSLKAVPPGQTALTRQELAERIVADALPVRFQLQMHKFIWPPVARGV